MAQKRSVLFVVLLLFIRFIGFATGYAQDPEYNVSEHYTKFEYRIPMRDGVRLHTVVYLPNDKTTNYPFLIKRTPYSSAPYGNNIYPEHIGPGGSCRFAEEGFIFVEQDVRGRFMSEGTFLHMTPNCGWEAGAECVDESTDMFDTVDWLLANIEGHNGKVGIYGISYPGFYVSASIINSHPAIKAASPQAPIGDWFIGDDFHHNGALFLQDAFRFFYLFESSGPYPTTTRGPDFDYGISDAYQFYLDLGPIKNVNEKYFQHRVAFWDSLAQHPDYDEFWQRRNILPELKNITANVMTVAGFFDAEDPYGPIKAYQSIEAKNPGIHNTLVMGPWFHGGWERSDGDHLGNVSFTNKTSVYYQEKVDLPFFKYFLKDQGMLQQPEVLAYATGSDQWHDFDTWPPANTKSVQFYLTNDRKLQTENLPGNGQTSYTSDPNHPVPYTNEIKIKRSREYMVEDQRFAARRPDVLAFQSELLERDQTFAGPIKIRFFFLTDATDLDVVVKVIDVFPNEEENKVSSELRYLKVPMGGYQMLIRGEVFRTRYRNGFDKPQALIPGQPTELQFDTPDIFHTFRQGHRIMVQIQSSWFPLVDRNPQQFVNIYEADAGDFRIAKVTILHNKQFPSCIEMANLK